MPTSRFWGYYEFLDQYYETKTPEDLTREKVEAIDWADEVKQLRKANGTRRKT